MNPRCCDAEKDQAYCLHNMGWIEVGRCELDEIKSIVSENESVNPYS